MSQRILHPSAVLGASSLCLGLGVVAGPALAPLLGAAVVGGVGVELAGGVLGDWLKTRARKAAESATAAGSNHDVQALVADAVEYCVREVAERRPLWKLHRWSERRALEACARRLRRQWPDIATSGLGEACRSPEIVGWFETAWATDDQSPISSPLSQQTWFELARDLDRDRLPEPLAREAAEHLYRHFTHWVRQRFKEDFGRSGEGGGKAFAAMQLALLGRVCELVKESGQQASLNPEAARKLDEIHRQATRLADDPVLRLRHVELVNQVTSVVAEMKRGFDALNRRVDRAEVNIQAEIATTREVIDRGFESLNASQIPIPQPLPAGNFVADAPPLGAFTPRPDIAEPVHAWLADPIDDRAFVLTGVGGSGKSLFATWLGHAAIDGKLPGSDFDAVWWLDASAEGGTRGLVRVSGAAGSPISAEVLARPEGVRDGVRQLAAALRGQSGRNSLLIIDNAEAGRDVGLPDPLLLAMRSPSKVLVTSQHRDYPDRLALIFDRMPMRQEEAIRLLTQGRPDLQTAGDHASVLIDIYREVDGLALALAVCSSYLGRPACPTPEALLGRLRQPQIDRHHPLLNADLLREATDYPRPLLATLALATEGITDQDQILLLQVVSMLAPEPVSAKLLTTLVDGKPDPTDHAIQNVLDRLEALRRAGIGRIDVTLGGATYRAHRQLQQVVRNSLLEGEIAAVRELAERLLRGFSASLNDLGNPATYPDRVAASAHAVAFAERIHHLDDPAIARRRDFVVLEVKIAETLQQIGDLVTAAVVLDRAIAVEEQGTSQASFSSSILYASRASIRQYRGDLPGAESDIARSIDWGEKQDPRDERRLADWYAIRGTVLADRSRLDHGIEQIQRSAQWYGTHQPHNIWKLSVLFRWESRMLALAQRWSEAENCSRRAVSLHVEAFGSEHAWTARAERAAEAIGFWMIPEAHDGWGGGVKPQALPGPISFTPHDSGLANGFFRPKALRWWRGRSADAGCLRAWRGVRRARARRGIHRIGRPRSPGVRQPRRGRGTARRRPR